MWRDRAAKTLSRQGRASSKKNRAEGRRTRTTEEPAKADKLGLSVRPLGADERKSAETEGYLLVEDVTGPAAQAGVRPGDVILGVNGKPVKSLAELKNATSSASKAVALLLERGGTPIFVPIRSAETLRQARLDEASGRKSGRLFPWCGDRLEVRKTTGASACMAAPACTPIIINASPGSRGNQ